jgi:hypothetical protein
MWGFAGSGDIYTCTEATFLEYSNLISMKENENRTEQIYCSLKKIVMGKHYGSGRDD